MLLERLVTRVSGHSRLSEYLVGLSSHITLAIAATRLLYNQAIWSMNESRQAFGADPLVFALESYRY